MISLLRELITLYIWLLIISAVLSWFPTSGSLQSVRRVLTQITEPVLRPIRTLLPVLRIGGMGLDLSILVAVIGLQIISSLL